VKTASLTEMQRSRNCSSPPRKDKLAKQNKTTVHSVLVKSKILEATLIENNLDDIVKQLTKRVYRLLRHIAFRSPLRSSNSKKMHSALLQYCTDVKLSSKAVKRRTDDCGIEACKSANACKPDNKKRVTPAMNFKGLKFADKHQLDK